MMLSTPLVWYGGKSTLVPHILPLLPPHTRYVEVFGGGLAVLIAKSPAKIEVANDKNMMLVTFWRVLRDPETGARLRHVLENTPYASKEYEESKATWRDESLDPVERVRRWYVAIMQSYTREETRNSGWRRPYQGTVHRVEQHIWVNRIDRLETIAHRLRRVALECMDFAELMPYYNTPDTLFFLDPPYMEETRSEQGNYEYEMTPEQHQHLLDLANETSAQVILTGYSSPMYEQALRSPTWTRFQVERPSQIHNNEQAGRVGTRTEVIWVKQHTLASIWHVDGLS